MVSGHLTAKKNHWYAVLDLKYPRRKEVLQNGYPPALDSSGKQTKGV